MTHSYRCCERAKENENDSKKIFRRKNDRGSQNNFASGPHFHSRVIGIVKIANLHMPANIGIGFLQTDSRKSDRTQLV
jgi:hypothetical protein